MSDYLTLNKTNWDERAPLHAASADYAVQRFVDDPQFLSDVVQFDRPLLGDIQGLRGVHLQCHIGTDTLSLARLGARMSGLDFSSASLAEARTLAQRCNTPIDYHESDVFAATDVLPRGEFDLVYTGIGALCWLPSIERWAQTVGALLKPGGRLFIREGHPMLWALDEEQRDSLQVAFPYFERSEPLVWDEDTTYVETESSLKATVTHEWNHGLGEIISALLAQGLEITGLVEHQSIPWEALPGQMVVDERGEWRLKEAPWRLPLSYTLQAVKRTA
ncbi:bifunctional 2-polyprenyl-6-hydroxyphenol methylase/3-demethylubiquinol 3-O-methyltransferase UbiG [Pseudomonas protegens]|uniref:class I SAM-dependent methyltransferase n=1 Tax=Pseudomonas protegens TaxID=380021 RepID=UPI000F49CC9E|nr:class I SAM-dependent methyltransferase [Pseudomonas protegens]ROL94065.1 SAM-dependent methyltransferase [Pseudomonas protegens]ROM00235.1 SAM-dependent methyltransferase [Pseudomonas protegens]ROM03723.1 SAM-dependent methyltransferase [Pseudomonas protegens]ROM11015.1 SAM-dependent methyltransferase [Pseudomonas protegens]